MAALTVALVLATSPANAAAARITFVGPSYHLLVMDDDGQNLDDIWPSAFAPRWSPDGKHILFIDGSTGALKVIDDNGGNVSTVKTAPVGVGAWSPDGKKIVYSQSVAGATSLHKVNRDGTDDELLTSGVGPDVDWAPNGALIAFTRNGSIWTIGADGSDPHAITTTTGDDRWPRFSPDGSKIVFARVDYISDVADEVYVVPTTGGGASQITAADNQTSWQPEWSPHGDKVVLTDAPSGGLATVPYPGGGTPTALPGAPAGAMWPDWENSPACQDVVVGKAVAKGCFTPIDGGAPGDYSTGQEAWVGGFHIRPKPHGVLVLHTQPGAPNVAEGGDGVEVLLDGRATSIPVASIPVAAGSAEIDLSGATGSVIAALWKLPVTGSLKVEWTEGGKSATITMAVKVEGGLLLASVGEVEDGESLEGEFTASLSNGQGLKVESAEVEVPPFGLKLPDSIYAQMPGGGPMKLGFAGGTFKYERVDDKPQFTIAAGFTFPFGTGRELGVSPTFVILDGKLSAFGLKIDGLNLQLAESGLWLQSVEGVGQWNPRFGLDLGAEATLGPKPPGSVEPLLELGGHLRMLELVSDACPGSWSEFGLTATIPILEQQHIGTGEIEGAACMLPGWGTSWVLNGHVKIELTVGSGDDEVEGAMGVEGTLSGAINGDGAYLSYSGDIHLPIPQLSIGPTPGFELGDLTIPVGSGVVSTIGYAFCANFGLFKGGFGANWNQPATLFGGCDVGPWTTPAAAASAAAAAVAQRTVTVPRGLPFAGIAAIAADGAPRVRISGPGGVRVVTTGKLVRTKSLVVYPSPATNRTYVFLRRPPAGRWHVVGVGGDTVTRVAFARGLKQPKVKARVRHRAKRWTLVYTIARRPGQRVRFAERSPSGGIHLLGRPTNRHRGTIRFTPHTAPERRRTIEATVTQNNLPRATLTVTRFRIPR